MSERVGILNVGLGTDLWRRLCDSGVCENVKSVNSGGEQMQSRVYKVDKVAVEGLLVVPENPPAIAVSAEGWVPTTGWSHPSLAPWMYIQPPADGILDLDFVVTSPTGLVLQVFCKIGVASAFVVPAWVKGVRVHSSTDSIVAMLPVGSLRPKELPLEGLPVPWPFPWWAPRTKPR
jgi:hypothetical protein